MDTWATFSRLKTLPLWQAALEKIDSQIHLVDSILSLSMRRVAASREIVHQTRQLKPWLPWQTLDYVTKYKTLPIRLLKVENTFLHMGYERDKRDRFAEEERGLYSRAYGF